MAPNPINIIRTGTLINLDNPNAISNKTIIKTNNPIGPAMFIFSL